MHQKLLMARIKGLIERQDLAIQKGEWGIVHSLEEEKRLLIEEALYSPDSAELVGEIRSLLIQFREKVRAELLQISHQILNLRPFKSIYTSKNSSFMLSNMA